MIEKKRNPEGGPTAVFGIFTAVSGKKTIDI